MPLPWFWLHIFLNIKCYLLYCTFFNLIVHFITVLFNFYYGGKSKFNKTFFFFFCYFEIQEFNSIDYLFIYFCHEDFAQNSVIEKWANANYIGLASIFISHSKRLANHNRGNLHKSVKVTVAKTTCLIFSTGKCSLKKIMSHFSA